MAGAAAAAAISKKERLLKLQQQLDKWKKTVNVDDPEMDGLLLDEELDQIDEETLMMAADMMDVDPGPLNRFDVTAPGQCYSDIDETNRRTRRGAPLADYEVTFEELLRKRHKEEEEEAVEYPIYDPDDLAPAREE